MTILETVTYQMIQDEHPTHLITRCVDASCPDCGAPYRSGLSVCEYCRQPVRPIRPDMADERMMK